MSAALEARRLRAGWGRRDLLQGLDLSVGAGERWAVLGPNGAGKSTLFDALGGRLRLRGGRVLLQGQDISRWPLHRRARAGLAYVPQEPCAFADLSVTQNLREALRSPAGRRGGGGAERLDQELDRWGLRALAGRRAALLSGGERRRLEVARALLLLPAVLLLDEPFAGLDPGGRAALAAGLSTLDPRCALVVTDHAAADVLQLCEQLAVLVDGRVVYRGPVDELDRTAPSVRRYFEGSPRV